MADPADIARANEPTAEELALARKILNSNTNYMNGWDTGQVNFRRDEIERCVLAAIVETTERAVRVVEQQQQDFLSPEYATGQPLSSFQERFACGQIADALRTYAHLKDPSHADG